LESLVAPCPVKRWGDKHHGNSGGRGRKETLFLGKILGWAGRGGKGASGWRWGKHAETTEAVGTMGTEFGKTGRESRENEGDRPCLQDAIICARLGGGCRGEIGRCGGFRSPEEMKSIDLGQSQKHRGSKGTWGKTGKNQWEKSGFVPPAFLWWIT